MKKNLYIYISVGVKLQEKIFILHRQENGSVTKFTRIGKFCMYEQVYHFSLHRKIGNFVLAFIHWSHF